MCELIKKLTQARQAYYAGEPIMTDQEYDGLEEQARQKEPDDPFFATVGHDLASAWQKASHQIPMGSLEKVHTQENFLKWTAKFPGELFIMELKLDGLSLSMDYEEGAFTRATTRGDGFIGEEITPNVRLMHGFKEKINGYSGSIRAEIVLFKGDFERINASLPNSDRYSNPRNAAAGISRRLDGLYSKYLTLITYDLDSPIDESAKIKVLEEMGFNTPEYVLGKVEDMLKAFEQFRELRSKLLFCIDGAVIKVNSYNTQQAVGVVDNRPKSQKAWKFDPPGAATPFLRETWDVGRTGVVTPLGHVEAIEIDGSIVRKVTLHNIAEIERLGLCRGDIVLLVKAGDVIPKILNVIEHLGGEPISIPSSCPSCGSSLLNDGIKLRCMNDGCPRKIFNRILNWIKVTKIDGFGESLVDELDQLGKLKKISDIYKLTVEDISTIEGWGLKSAEKIIENINKVRTLPPAVFMTALGIPGISEKTSEELLAACGGDLKVIRTRTVDDIKVIKGYSDISANNIVTGLFQNAATIDELLTIISLSVEKNAVGALSNKSFCFTGAMTQPRTFYQNLVKKNGGKNSDAVTKELTYLVCNENKGSSKSIKAAKFGVPIINEQDFLNMIGGDINIPRQPQRLENYPLFE